LEQLAVLHGTVVDHYYGLEKLVAGRTRMGDEEAAETDGRYRFRVGLGAVNGDERDSAYPLPVLYTLLATKLAAS
jgi:hypothetical protein